MKKWVAIGNIIVTVSFLVTLGIYAYLNGRDDILWGMGAAFIISVPAVAVLWGLCKIWDK